MCIAPATKTAVNALSEVFMATPSKFGLHSLNNGLVRLDPALPARATSRKPISIRAAVMILFKIGGLGLQFIGEAIE